MSDLQTLLREAAAPAENRTVDAGRAMRRGEQLRKRRTAARLSSLAVVALAVPLVLSNVGSNTVEFAPDKRPVYSTPSPSPSPSPAPTAPVTPAPEDVIPDPSAVVPVEGRDTDADAVPGTTTTQGGQASGTAAAPANEQAAPPRRDPDNREPAGETSANPPPEDKPRENRPRPDPSPTGPPPAASCELRGSELEMGESASCEFTATHAGGYFADGTTAQPFIYPADMTAPEYWKLKIVRGDRVIRRSATEDDDEEDFTCRDDYIQVGDVVTATIYRPDPAEDDGFSGWTDFFVGRGHGCPE